MKKDIQAIKKATDLYLKKHPVDSIHGMPISVADAFTEKLTGQSIHGDIDGIMHTVADIFNYGFSQGMKQANVEFKNGAVKSIAIGRSTADHNLVDAIKAVARDGKGGARS